MLGLDSGLGLRSRVGPTTGSPAAAGSRRAASDLAQCAVSVSGLHALSFRGRVLVLGGEQGNEWSALWVLGND